MSSSRTELAAYLDLVAQRARHVGEPRTHENGFIQVPVGEYARLHVWPDVPILKQKSDLPIHDHTFSFRSWVLAGELDHSIYDLQTTVVPEGAFYEIHRVTDRGKLAPTDLYANAKLLSRHLLPVGSVYELKYEHFHETQWREMTVTLMIKTHRRPGRTRAHVLCPQGQVVDNEFDRFVANSVDQLWGIVDRGIDAARSHMEVWD